MKRYLKLKEGKSFFDGRLYTPGRIYEFEEGHPILKLYDQGDLADVFEEMQVLTEPAPITNEDVSKEKIGEKAEKEILVESKPEEIVEEKEVREGKEDKEEDKRVHGRRRKRK